MRMLVKLSLLGALGWAVYAALPDVKRYLEMRAM